MCHAAEKVEWEKEKKEWERERENGEKGDKQDSTQKAYHQILRNRIIEPEDKLNWIVYFFSCLALGQQ